MIQDESENRSPIQNEYYFRIVKHMHNLYGGNISEQEAHEAARNLIGFCRTLLAMKAEQEQNLIHAE